MSTLAVADPEIDVVEVPVEPAKPRRSTARTLAYLVLPLLVLALAAGVGYLKWQASSAAPSGRRVGHSGDGGDRGGDGDAVLPRRPRASRI